MRLGNSVISTISSNGRNDTEENQFIKNNIPPPLIFSPISLSLSRLFIHSLSKVYLFQQKGQKEMERERATQQMCIA